MATQLKAIETAYKGYRFRSRLEARWAVFFDALRVPYEYEPQGFDLDGVRYLPDFWLPTVAAWFEVKGGTAEGIAQDKAQRLATASGHRVVIATADPMATDSILIAWPHDRPLPLQTYYWGVCAVCSALHLGRPHPPYCGQCGVTVSQDVSWEWRQARELARGARFEHGAAPSIAIPACTVPTGNLYIAGKMPTRECDVIREQGGHGGCPHDRHYGNQDECSRIDWRDDLPGFGRHPLHVVGPSFVYRDEYSQHAIPAKCFAEIQNSHVVFAWINTVESTGTMIEVGYAKAARKPVCIALGPDVDSETLWFAEHTADLAIKGASTTQAFRVFLQWWRMRLGN